MSVWIKTPRLLFLIPLRDPESQMDGRTVFVVPTVTRRVAQEIRRSIL